MLPTFLFLLCLKLAYIESSCISNPCEIFGICDLTYCELKYGACGTVLGYDNYCTCLPNLSTKLCQAGWIANPNGLYCYKVFNDPRTAFEAQLACFSMNAFLATINDQTEFNFIVQNVMKGYVYVWVKYYHFNLFKKN
jgi:hypothetical protein